jgi:hypothetical protein
MTDFGPTSSGWALQGFCWTVHGVKPADIADTDDLHETGAIKIDGLEEFVASDDAGTEVTEESSLTDVVEAEDSNRPDITDTDDLNEIDTTDSDDVEEMEVSETAPLRETGVAAIEDLFGTKDTEFGDLDEIVETDDKQETGVVETDDTKDASTDGADNVDETTDTEEDNSDSIDVTEIEDRDEHTISNGLEGTCGIEVDDVDGARMTDAEDLDITIADLCLGRFSVILGFLVTFLSLLSNIV